VRNWLKNTDKGGEIYDDLDNHLIYIFFLMLTAEEYEMLLEIEHLTEVMDKLNRIIRQHVIAKFRFVFKILQNNILQCASSFSVLEVL
jgi:hypothetical protein